MRGVLHVVLSLNPGGTERLVIEVVRRTHRLMPTAVCCLDEPGQWADEVARLGVTVTALRRAPGFRPALGRELARAAARCGAGILHCHQYSPFVYGRMAQMWQPRLDIVYTEHGRLSDAPPSLKRRVVNPLLGVFRGPIVAVSADLREHLVASGFRRGKVRVIYNGVAPGTVPGHEDRLRARELLDVPRDACVVGTVARLDPVKDLGTLLKAFQRVVERHPTVLVVIGDGSERPNLERQARSLGLEGSVRFAGERRDVRDLLPALDLFVNTSISEGISITILEAMAACLPVVATRVGGNPEVVVHGDTGLLVEARAPGAVADALVRMLGDRDLRTRCGVSGRRRVEGVFSVDRMVGEYLQTYRGLAAGGGA